MPAKDAAGAGRGLQIGAAVVEITPPGSVFLFGYPHVPRMSTGVHDPLECAALYAAGPTGRALFLANDLIYFSRDFAREVRGRIAAATGLRVDSIMLSATHTHSGPVTTDKLTNAADPVVPKADPAYLRWLADRMVTAATTAVASALPAEIGLARATAQGVGTNRHNPDEPADPEVPVLLARALGDGRPLACLLVYAMHPTVLHEDSKLISADFPGFTRRWLRRKGLPPDCPILYLQGCSGNQSPRYVTRANTFAEARRIGEKLGRFVADAIRRIEFRSEVDISSSHEPIEVEPRSFPPEAEAWERLADARERLDALRRGGAPRQVVRTAECDVFGAEKTAELARAAGDGRLAAAIATASPAEIQVIAIGPWRFVGWPGEFYVEHGLALKSRVPDTFVVTLANGELQGYIATPDAVAWGAYEATNAIFSVGNGPRFVEKSLELLGRSAAPGAAADCPAG